MTAGGAPAAWRLGVALLLSLLGHLLLLIAAGPGRWQAAAIDRAGQGGYALQVEFRAAGTRLENPVPSLTAATPQRETVAAPPADASYLSENGSQRAPMVDAPRYYSLHELDVPPYASGELPDDPPELQAHNQAGRLTLELWIDAQGMVMRVDCIASDLPDIFFQQAQGAFLAMPFVPAQKEGQAVAARIRIAMEYQKRYASQTVQ